MAQYPEEVVQSRFIEYVIHDIDAADDDAHVSVVESGSHCGQGVGSPGDQRPLGGLRSVLDGEVVDVLFECAGLRHRDRLYGGG